ncbi:proprotein convertase P-domain-containing protein [Novosphingobium sp.]|uniref:proprotein convertase P-domain-containing protein n=1 Tax=Novosphingobium sp. TaxID=1874826 RepID=UPI0035B42A7D
MRFNRNLGVSPARRWGRLLAAIAAICAALGGVAAPASAQSVNRYTNTADSAANAISDSAAPCANPFKRTFNVSTSYVVSSVSIGVLIAHTYRGDLVMNLVSPDGTRVNLTSGSGSVGADNFNATFDDAAPGAISSYTANDTASASTIVPPYNGNYRPAALLSAFNGKNAAGTWTLEVCDQFQADSGTFYQADLYLTGASGPYADLSLSMTSSTSAPTSGGAISYSLTVSSSAGSTSSASGITVSAPLPSGTVFVASSGSGSYNPATGLWSVGTLAPGENATLVLSASVDATAGAAVEFPAEITASSVADIDSTPGNGAVGEDDYASASFTVAGARSAGIAPMLTCPAGTSLLDWDAVSWTNGSTAASYSVSGIGTVALAISNPGSFLNNATYGGQSPTRQKVVTGGLASPQYSLMELVDLPSQSSQVTTTITMSSPAAGAQFTIFDVDYASGQFADKVTVTGSLGGVTVIPTLTNGIANYVIGNSAYGDATSSDTQANGNVTVTFASAVDTIIISYGDHSLAPANPGQQAIAIHDITMCRPSTTLSVTKASSVISDPVNGATLPKAIPGAVVEYCILVTNAGSAAASNVTASDTFPAAFTYAAGSMFSGPNCASATTAEDDDASGTDESDPIGASVTGNVMTAATATLGAGATFALRYRGVVN